jgi:hypothetical protein
MSLVKPTEDITELKIDLEKYKKKIEELDSNNRDLSMQWSRLSVELRDKEATFKAKVKKFLQNILLLTILSEDDSQGDRNGIPGQTNCGIQKNVRRDETQDAL